MKEQYTEKCDAHRKLIADVFAPVKFDFDSIKVESYFSHDQITLTIKEDHYHWSSDVLTIYLRFDRNWREETFGEMAISFNHGSGGYNDGFTAKELLAVKTNIFAGGTEIADIAEQNEDLLRDTMAAYESDYRELTKIWSAEREEIEAGKIAEMSKEVEKLTRTLTPLTGQEIIDRLEKEITDGGYFGKVETLNFVVRADKFYIERQKYEIEFYGDRKVLKHNGSRTSKKKILAETNELFVDIYTDLRDWAFRRVANNGFENVDEFFTRLNEEIVTPF